MHMWETKPGRREGWLSIIHALECVLWGLNESQCALMGHHKQTMKNESGEAAQLLFFLWEQLRTSMHTFGDNRFVCVCANARVCVCVIQFLNASGNSNENSACVWDRGLHWR